MSLYAYTQNVPRKLRLLNYKQTKIYACIILTVRLNVQVNKLNVFYNNSQFNVRFI